MKRPASMIIVAFFAVPATAETIGRAAPPGPSVASVMGALALCLAVALAAALLLRTRIGGLAPIRQKSAGRRLDLVERLPLTRTAQLCLVRLDGSEALLAVLPDRVVAVEFAPPAARLPER